MKYVLIIIVIFCVGCSSAIRDRSYVAINGEGWEIQNGRASYDCGLSVLSLGSVAESRLFVAGPVVPLVPFTHEYPGYLTITASESESCPTIIFGDSELEAYENHQYEQDITCQYKLGRINDKDEVVLEFSQGYSCKANPLRFKQKNSWDYCLVCSA